MLKRSNGVTSLMGLGLMLPVLAQAALSPSAQPDAGRLSRELQAPPVLPQPGITMTVPTPGREVVQSGGLRITLNKVAFAGNTVFSQQQLTEVLQSSLGKQYDLAGLFQLADQISVYYRERGYSFAKAFVPEDGFRDGVLIMQVVEGNYGERKALADSPRRSAQAQRFLEPLRAGDPIHTPTLEKRLLILDSLPGYSVLPVIKPGAETGSGDLDVRLTRTALATGSVGLSNHGNRYTGYYLARANVSLNSPFMFGDQLSFSLLSSDQSLQSSSVNYSMPLGGNGMRATAAYSLTDYRLGREFTSLRASGRAQTTSVGLSYPVLRSREANLTASMQMQHKRFFDEQKAVSTKQSRASDSGVLMLSFDRTGNQAVTYGQVEWAMGSFDGGTPDPAKTNGRFSRINADVIRLQRVMDRLNLYVRLNAQLASENLDSSESFSLGGPYGVRAYTSGEGTGDDGLLTQLELRYQSSATLAPFMFFDAGRSRLEHKPTSAGKNSRSLSGVGAGLRYQRGPLSLETLIAHRLVGGDPQSDPRDDALTAWIIFNYAF